MAMYHKKKSEIEKLRCGHTVLKAYSSVNPYLNVRARSIFRNGNRTNISEINDAMQVSLIVHICVFVDSLRNVNVLNEHLQIVSVM